MTQTKLYILVFAVGITAEIDRIKTDMKKVERIVMEKLGVCVNCHGKISGVDGKIITWISQTIGNVRCSICKELPNQYRGKVEFFFDSFSLEIIDQLCATILHYGINGFNHLINLACKKRIGCTSWKLKNDQSPEFKDALKYFQNKIMKDKKLKVGFPNPSGGTTTTGNVVS